jgi:hypothetical protein
MVFSCSDLKLYLSDSLTNNNFLKAISTNPFYASMVIVIVLLLTVLIVFRNVSLPKNESIYKLLIRTGVYAYGAVLVVMYCHNYYMKKSVEGAVEISEPNLAQGEHEDIAPRNIGAAEITAPTTVNIGSVGGGVDNTQSAPSAPSMLSAQTANKLPSFI